jgi:hypothetical protein
VKCGQIPLKSIMMLRVCKADFRRFTQCLTCRRVEKFVFPILKEHLDLSTELAQHKVIHAGLDEILAIIRKAKTNHSEFNPSKLKGIMESLRDPLASLAS